MRARLHLLLADHQEADVTALRRALQDLGLQAQLHVAASAEEAVVLLQREPHISLVLLEHDLPPGGGVALLEQLKAHPDPNLRRVPVIMLGSVAGEEARSQERVRQAYHAHASAYLPKPPHTEHWSESRWPLLLEALLVFWGQVARLPPREALEPSEP